MPAFRSSLLPILAITNMGLIRMFKSISMCRRLRVLPVVFAVGALLPGAAESAAEIGFVGRLGSKALLQIDGGKPRMVAVGSVTPEGVRLVSLQGDKAVVEVGGESLTLSLGEGPIRPAPEGGLGDLVLHSDTRGHFEVDGAVNGATVRFVVDTGASLVSLGAGDARRAGIDYRSGVPATSLTAAGPVRVWRVRLDSVRIGSSTIHNVEAAVHEQDLPVVLLGMSVLNRFEMRRQGRTLTLQRRY